MPASAAGRPCSNVSRECGGKALASCAHFHLRPGGRHTMSNQSLAEELFTQLQGAPLQQVSQQLGIGQMQTSGAVAAALPLLLGALGKNAAQPQGAEAL